MGRTITTNREGGFIMMDKVYIDNNQRSEVVKLPKYGEVKLIVKDGKVVQYYTTESHITETKKKQECY